MACKETYIEIVILWVKTRWR